MNVVVFGANGKVGSLVVAGLLHRGHIVTAFVHSNTSLQKNDNLQIIKGDICVLSDVVKAIKGSEAVISTLGSWGSPKKDILTVGMKHIIPAMKKHSVSRIISLTGADALASRDSISLLTKLSRPALLLVAKKILRDGEQHIKFLEQSGLDWTVVRSPVMVERGDPNRFQLSNQRPFPWQTIHRHSVANSMVNLLESKDCLRQAPFISRS